jgi:hypothetical protein
MAAVPSIDFRSLTSTLAGAISISDDFGMMTDEMRPAGSGIAPEVAGVSASEIAGDEVTNTMAKTTASIAKNLCFMAPLLPADDAATAFLARMFVSPQLPGGTSLSDYQ